MRPGRAIPGTDGLRVFDSQIEQILISNLLLVCDSTHKPLMAWVHIRVQSSDVDFETLVCWFNRIRFLLGIHFQIILICFIIFIIVLVAVVGVQMWQLRSTWLYLGCWLCQHGWATLVSPKICQSCLSCPLS